MDTSETYIKMRLAAIPDLGIGELPQINRDIEDNSIEPEWITSDIFVDAKGDFYYSKGINDCQLERQDQLQEMIGKPLWQINFKFDGWLYDIDSDGLCDFHIKHSHLGFNSMEQLWLAFLMKEKYNKIWNGEDWIKDGTATD